MTNATKSPMPPMRRVLFLIPIILVLLLALWAGLYRIGWAIPVGSPYLPANHAPLMLSGFLGSLIILERAVALQQRKHYIGVLLGIIGSGALVAGYLTIGKFAFLLASLWLIYIFSEILRIHFTGYTVIMALGAFSWLWGNVMWLLGIPVGFLFVWWFHFLLLTIIGERIELGRIVSIPAWANRGIFMLCAMMVLSAMIFKGHVLIQIISVFYCLFALWLLRFDVVRRTIRASGLPQFSAAALIAGYCWLFVGGAIGIFMGIYTSNYHLDAYVHSLFIGFVMSMIFAHGPIIFPAIFQREARFSRWLYLPLIILHVSLLLRVSGDLLFVPEIRRLGGLLNVTAILVYLPSVFRLAFAKTRVPV